MGVRLDVTQAFYFPERRLRVGSLEEFGVLEGDHLIVGGVDDEEWYPLFAEACGVFTWLHCAGVEAQKELCHEEDTGVEEAGQTAGLGDLLFLNKREGRVARLFHYRPHTRSP